MNNLREFEVADYVDRLFKAKRGKDMAEIPIIGGWYCPKEDRVSPLKRRACRALTAQEWHRKTCPAGPQPLPLSPMERQEFSGVQHILALFARSLENRDWDVTGHPIFDEFARGVMASPFALPVILEDVELQRRYPPKPLAGLGLGCCWRPEACIGAGSNN